MASETEYKIQNPKGAEVQGHDDENCMLPGAIMIRLVTDILLVVPSTDFCSKVQILCITSGSPGSGFRKCIS